MADAVADARFVFCCSGNDQDLRAVAEPAIDAMAAGAVFVDHTTASADLARELAGRAEDREVASSMRPSPAARRGEARRAHRDGRRRGGRLRAAAPLIESFAARWSVSGPPVPGS